MRAIRLVACHRGDLESFEKTPLCRSAKGRFPLYVCLENTQGLPLRYNQFLTGAWEAFTLVGEFDRESAPDDILVFLHDDVEIVSNNVEPELNRWAERGYAILGLAGAARVRIEAPAQWEKMGEPGSGSGVSVFHNVRVDPHGNYVSMPDQPYPTQVGRLRDVVVLDGLFLAVVSDVVRAAGWKFDEDYDFHHYDLASCLRAREMGLKLRTVMIPVVHWSIGLKDPNDPVFLRNQAVFLKNFG